MYGMGNYGVLGSDISDPYTQGYYNYNAPQFVGATHVPTHSQPEADKFERRNKDDGAEKILLLGALGIAIGALILKGKVSIANLYKGKK